MGPSLGSLQRIWISSDMFAVLTTHPTSKNFKHFQVSPLPQPQGSRVAGGLGSSWLPNPKRSKRFRSSSSSLANRRSCQVRPLKMVKFYSRSATHWLRRSKRKRSAWSGTIHWMSFLLSISVNWLQTHSSCGPKPCTPGETQNIWK